MIKQQLKVYYLDDESLLLEAFADNFATNDILIETFSCVDVFLKAFAQTQPDLVFLDFRLPNTTGEQVAKKLPSEIPKALITGELSIEAQGAFERVFFKPFSVPEIEQYLQSHLLKKAN